ncbi:hypothetical protein ACIQMY_10520 [Streptomyces sp. NPDC091368]|uniref:hypothetical protein n=1 Tax=Streptomyces sp. NPDC091368 TaxID=3365993 RepID=UPI0038137FD4
MADERYQWLDQEAAERLLRGEPVEALDDRTRHQAERLAQALGAARVPATPPAPDAELPGEAAALAAFREATAERAATTAPSALSAAAGRGRDLGRVRLAPATAPARRWGRSVRYGLTAAFAAVTVGGVAVAAGTGVLPLVGPAPATSVSAEETADRLVSKEPGIGQDPEAPPTDPGRGDPTPGPSPSAEGSTPPTPGASAGGGPTTPAPRTPEPGRTTARPGATEDSGATGDPGSADLREKVLKACRQYRTGRLDAAGRRQLMNTLRGGETLRLYCDRILSGDTGTPKGDGSQGRPEDDGKGDEDTDGGREGGTGRGGEGRAPGENHGGIGNGGTGGIRDRAGSTLPDARLQSGTAAAAPGAITTGARVPLGV